MKLIKNLVIVLITVGFSIHTSNAQVAPDSLNGLYSFKVANVYFEIDKATGARVSSLKLDNNEFMYVSKAAANNNWGSTFWPSPQTLFNWPPPANLDNKAYTVHANATNVTMQSALDATTKFSFKKTFSANAVDTSIVLQYDIYNGGTAAKSVSPWEITRIPSGGLTFFGKGTTTMTGALATLMKDTLGAIWFDYDSLKIPKTGTPKLFSDGSGGYMVHINNDRSMLIKKFDNVLAAQQATGEAEIELYTENSANKYVEMEEQGAYASLAVGATKTWTVKWFARMLPVSLVVSPNQSLIDYVQLIINRSVLGIESTDVSESMITVRPNPIENTAIFDLNLHSDCTVKIVITDVDGKEYIAKTENVSFGNQSIKIDTQHLAKGIYLAKIIIGDNVEVIKILK